MYSQILAQRLRDRDHDALSVHERLDLGGTEDREIFDAAQRDRRAILTNNAPHFIPMALRAMESGAEQYGLLLTDDRAMPRGRNALGPYIELLDVLMGRNPADDAFVNQIRWLTRPT